MKSYSFKTEVQSCGVKYFKSICLSLLTTGILFVSPAIADSDVQKGDEIYEINCLGCHMPDGKGDQGVGMYPALANNIKLSSVSATVEVVTNGLNGMPSFREYLTDDEILEVVNYIRINFGNNFKDIAQLTDIPKNN
ncbi:MAG: cytochrome c [Campylobacteraceae bacterium]|jgi:mono/diheme cytochrome c family protein|nr:cytochrome c [Campylobacteraceae bacterium]